MYLIWILYKYLYLYIIVTEVVNGMIEVNKRDGGDVVDEKDLSEFRL